MNVVERISQRATSATQVATYYRAIHHLLNAARRIEKRKAYKRRENIITRTSLNAYIDSKAENSFSSLFRPFFTLNFLFSNSISIFLLPASTKIFPLRLSFGVFSFVDSIVQTPQRLSGLEALFKILFTFLIMFQDFVSYNKCIKGFNYLSHVGDTVKGIPYDWFKTY